MKKIFAKEVLVLLVCCSLTILSYLFILIYNYSQQSTINKNLTLVNENEKSISKIQKSFNDKVEKQISIFNWYVKEYNRGRLSNPYKLWERTKILIENDSLRKIFQLNESFENSFYTVLGVNNYDDFVINFKNNTLSINDSLNQLKSDSLTSVNNNLKSFNQIIESKKVDDIKMRQLIFKIFLITILLSFGVRYFILLFKWSIDNYK